jgi:Nif-specific regulatory protein
MSWKLVALEGPRAGEVFNLAAGEVSIGRDDANVLRLDDLQVSRPHCIVRVSECGATIEDLNSRNGVYVNDTPARHESLANGDHIRIGNTILILVAERAYGDPARIEPTEETASWETMTFAPGRVGEQASTAELCDALAATKRAAREVATLLGVATSLANARDAESAYRLLLDLLFEVVPAERGAVVVDAVRRDPEVAATSPRRPTRAAGPFRIPADVVERVMHEEVAVLRRRDEEGAEDGGWQRAASALAVPIAVDGRLLGAVYLDSSSTSEPLDERHLALASAAATIAALTLLNVESIEWSETERRRLSSGVLIDHQMIGESPPMQSVYSAIQRVAHTNATVLIRGESGTGKELVARAIHRNSARASKPFVAINCATLTESLLESELFGHEKGAFTGATTQKRGKLEVADGGTVFLDEIGEMPPSLQAKLLRAIQERQFERVGGTQPVQVDVRWIAATNVDLEHAIASGRFRRDLYYRLDVISLAMPALRDRKEDIPLLAAHFMTRYAEKCGRRITGMSRDARSMLMRYAWPGNVRELQNTVERAVVLGTGEQIAVEDLPETITRAPYVADGGFQELVTSFKRTLVANALEEAGGDLAKAARLLELHPRYMYRLLKKLGIDVHPDERHDRRPLSPR